MADKNTLCFVDCDPDDHLDSSPTHIFPAAPTVDVETLTIINPPKCYDCMKNDYLWYCVDIEEAYEDRKSDVHRWLNSYYIPAWNTEAYIARDYAFRAQLEAVEDYRWEVLTAHWEQFAGIWNGATREWQDPPLFTNVVNGREVLTIVLDLASHRILEFWNNPLERTGEPNVVYF